MCLFLQKAYKQIDNYYINQIFSEAFSVAALVHRSAAPTPSTASEAWNRQRNPGMVYMLSLIHI